MQLVRQLRQWASNCLAVVANLPSDTRSNSCELWLSQGLQDTHESALGLLWHCQLDTTSTGSYHYKVFVGIQVALIQELTASVIWLYVQSEDNPADSITRGKRLCDLGKGSQWNQGPSFTKQ
ncbi:GMP synthase [glutamine-hydrolyzing] subunit A [Labeo rohita]|uniref:GMP synthase [glutamine-hydrolyzing] subunit A n=1 Tax=Labeo rohita TaxID=84645 RepID=A0ABQ8MW54_LABRO|nr:GMP synthase [glutamine-hydrolyzing] subunit A [Labeo rohita]